MIDNPYLKAWKEIAPLTIVGVPSWRHAHHDLLCRRFAWALPDARHGRLIAQHALRLVEIGAGTGYWAWYLAQFGVSTIAYDVEPYLNDYAQGRWWSVYRGDAGRARHYPDRALFLCWPPTWNDMASFALASYTGATLVYVGEDMNGCTGDYWFHEMVERDWQIVASANVFSYQGLHDRLLIYHRKGQ